MGIALARREMRKNGNPPIEFDVNASYVLAIPERETDVIPVIAFLNNKGGAGKPHSSIMSPGNLPI